MELIKKPIVAAFTGVVFGFVLGLLWAWGISPVEYTGAIPKDLTPEYQQIYLMSVANNLAITNNPDSARAALLNWDNAYLTICSMQETAIQGNDALTQSRLVNLLNAIGASCPAPGETPVDNTDQTGGFNYVAVCGSGILLLVLIGVILFLYLKNLEEPDAVGVGPKFDPTELAGEAPTSETGDMLSIETTPVARFRTTYKRGHDTFDDSFSIENANGEFLGECGVGISESIGSGSPKNVTALEIWLFDKNDIRTITKVIMSDLAFFDDALKAKLAPKGEPVLGRQGETVVLETESLIINAVLTDLTYGDSPDLPKQSYFDSFRVELSAWSKEGEFAGPDIEGRVDELLNY